MRNLKLLPLQLKIKNLAIKHRNLSLKVKFQNTNMLQLSVEFTRSPMRIQKYWNNQPNWAMLNQYLTGNVFIITDQTIPLNKSNQLQNSSI